MRSEDEADHRYQQLDGHGDYRPLRRCCLRGLSVVLIELTRVVDWLRLVLMRLLLSLLGGTRPLTWVPLLSKVSGFLRLVVLLLCANQTRIP